MKLLLAISLIVCSVLLYSCSRTPSPTAPGSPQSTLTLSFSGYGEILDSTYYKVWSDSSWEEFAMDTTISGTTYAVLLTSTGYEYFYGPDGFAGFWPYGGSLIMFDSSLASLPDSLVKGKTYTLETTFASGGLNFTLTDQETLEDSGSVTVPFGTFSDCVELQSTIAISGGGQSQSQTTQYWYAKGPSDIEQQPSGGATILMAYGFVNGRTWGPSVAAESPRLKPEIRVAEMQSVLPSTREVQPLDIRAIAPGILRGVIR